MIEYMTAKTTKSEGSLNDHFQELEVIVQELETEKVDLEESIKKFERGLELADLCKKRLTEVENKVIEIKKKFGVSEE